MMQSDGASVKRHCLTEVFILTLFKENYMTSVILGLITFLIKKVEFYLEVTIRLNIRKKPRSK